MSFGDSNVGAGVQNCGSNLYESVSNVSASIEVQLTFETNGEPVRGEEYLVTTPDGTEIKGFLDGDGYAKVMGIVCEEGEQCEVSFPNLDEEAWDDG
ncbi:MAG: hypothetical protein AAFN77_20850 [Planctomycetota bacterium]